MSTQAFEHDHHSYIIARQREQRAQEQAREREYRAISRMRASEQARRDKVEYGDENE
jgi:hypothetical protein